LRGADLSGEIDAADEWKPAQDRSSAGSCKGVFVVDARILDSDDDVTRCQIIERKRLEPTRNGIVVAMNSKSLERITHG
jgi:hypothetical protein